jgi:hypothetical protein
MSRGWATSDGGGTSSMESELGLKKQSLGCYFYEINVSYASFAKRIVWTTKNAIVSPLSDSTAQPSNRRIADDSR